jgi:opacity protein-like surface antigen
MKTITLASVATAVVMSAAAGTASAQDAAPGTWTSNWYGTLGYAGHSVDGTDLGTVQGRIGTKFNRWIGIEGEFAAGVDHNAIGGAGAHQTAGINDQEAIYGVGYLPLGHDIDLFGRIGYGRTRWDYKGPVGRDDNDTSWNYGGGAQWFFDPKDGIRADYTRENFDHAPDANTWGVSFVRKF